MVAVAKERKDVVNGSHAAGKREPVSRALERGQALFQCPSCRMLGTRVAEAAMDARLDLAEGRSLIDRNGDGAGGCIVGLPGVDGECVETVHVPLLPHGWRRTLMLLTFRGEKL